MSANTGSEVSFLLKWLISLRLIPKAAVMQLENNYAPYASSVLDAGRLAEQTYAELDALDNDIVLIARMGQDLSQFGLKYSHLGYAVRGVKRNEWGVIHLLNRDSSGTSGIYQEGLVNFYSDNPFRFEAEIFTLPLSKEELKLAREKLMLTALDFHCSNYSLTSHPWSLSTQNSNQWVLEFLASILEESVTDRASAQIWLKEKGYTPSNLPIKLPTQWVGPLLKDSISFKDQPEEQQLSELIQTITVDSVIDYLKGESSPFGEKRKFISHINLNIG